MIRVLLIEDDSDDVAKVKKALEFSEKNAYLESYDFIEVGTLSRGLQVLKTEKVDVVLLDMGLPDARDFQGVDKLRQEFPLIPIVIMTKHNEETLVALEAVKRGAEDYFGKGQLVDGFSPDRIVRYAVERKKREHELILAMERADKASAEALRASKAKSDFLANMSHDIRTPLNCIIGVADLLTRAKLSEDDSNYVQMLNKAADNLLALINDVLDLSRIESGQIKINNADFDLPETVGTILDVISTKAHAKGLELIFKIQPDVPRRLVGDKEHLCQVLMNLLGNAIKFTKTGEILLSVSQIEQADNSSTIAFAVKDTGVGIPEDKINLVFESFTQLEQDSSLKRQGSGLGLSICDHLVRLMGGQIKVQSQVGVGSTFEFQIPFELPQKSTSQKVVPPLNLEGIDVLIVESNEALRKNLSDLLYYWGASVTLAQNSDDAVHAAQLLKMSHKSFDIGLFDLRIPGVSSGGIEIYERIKDWVGCPVIMLPTNHRYGDIEKLKNAGIKRYYFKPTKPEKLAEMISEILHLDLHKKPLSSRQLPKIASHAKLNLLVADDSEENRQLIQAYCKDTGFTLELVENGQEALSKFKEKHFDLVLMDLQMPTMNGYEALSAIRSWEEEQKRDRVPILALTAYALNEEAQRCLSAGFMAHVTKPIKKNDLIQTIKKYAA